MALRYELANVDMEGTRGCCWLSYAVGSAVVLRGLVGHR